MPLFAHSMSVALCPREQSRLWRKRREEKRREEKRREEKRREERLRRK
jgi:hypothetical protein